MSHCSITKKTPKSDGKNSLQGIYIYKEFILMSSAHERSLGGWDIYAKCRCKMGTIRTIKKTNEKFSLIKSLSRDCAFN